MAAIPAFLLPEDETRRLQTLHAYELLLAFQQEPVFKEFVTLTARVFSLPISLIALVDAEQVHYPANHGMPGNDQQPREEALCSTVVAQNKAVVYRDLATEENPLITSEAAEAARRNQLRFYAAAPLRVPINDEQHTIGTLCVIDRQPRTFSEPERHTLQQVAALVAHTLVVRHACQRSVSGARRWPALQAQLLEEVQALTALVRYLFARNGTPVPVPADLLAQVERRLRDVEQVLAATPV